MTVQSVDRALQVLELLSAAPRGLTVTEIASKLDVHRAVAYRLLATLGRHRTVLRGEDGRYRLWTGLVELARGVGADWRVVAWPELELLADEVRATAVLSVASGSTCVALLAAEPRTAILHVAYQPGLRHPLSVGASGKAILAGRPSVEGETREIARARRRGFAVSRGEIQAGAMGVAAPIVTNGRADASVAVVSLAELDGSVAGRVREAAERIANALTGG